MTDATGATTHIPADLSTMKVADLQSLAASLGIRGGARLRKGELVTAIEAARDEAPDTADAGAFGDADADGAETHADNESQASADDEASDDAPADDESADTESAAADEAPDAPESEPESEPEPASDSGDAISATVFPQESGRRGRGSRRVTAEAGDAPMSLDDLVLPPARGEATEDEEPRRGRRRRVAVAEGSPADSDEAEGTSSGGTANANEGSGDNDDEQDRGGSRRRGRGRNRRGRSNDNEQQADGNGNGQSNGNGNGQSDDNGDSQGDDEQQGGDEQQSRRNRSRGRQGPEQSNDDEGDDRRGRGRYRDRKRGRGDDVDPEIAPDDVLLPIAGILDVLDNYAFVRTSGYLPGPNDVYVSLAQVKKYGLRKGDAIVGAVRQPREGEQQHGRQKFNAIVKFDSINGQAPDDTSSRPVFDELTALYPEERLRLETGEGRVTQRMIDLFAPIGKGTRGLIVAPPKAGKSVVLQQIANAIAENSPSTHLMLVLVDERPEEVTSMRRTIRGEVVASTFDLPAEDHTTIAELAIERAKRLVELGHDVVVLLDSITALSRAYNLTAPASGRILAGGVDAAALYPPKRFFGAARNVENGGSLTILATAKVETGSRTDEVILEEFAGKGNMELRLSREIADRRIFPAIDLQHSQTLQEEQLLSEAEVDATWAIRRELSHGDTRGALEAVLDRLTATSSNEEFLRGVRQQPIAGGSR